MVDFMLNDSMMMYFFHPLGVAMVDVMLTDSMMMYFFH